MGISNPKVQEHMEAIFGKERLGELREEVENLPPAARENAITDALERAVDDLGAPNLAVHLPQTGRPGKSLHLLRFEAPPRLRDHEGRDG